MSKKIINIIYFIIFLSATWSYAISPEYSDTLRKQLPRAENGDVKSQKSVGFTYYIEEEFKKACYWFHKASNQNDLKSQQMLGRMYMVGQGCQQSYKSSMKYFQMAADGGDIESCFFLGVAYNNGLGVPSDATKAFELFTKAANGGVLDAQTLLSKYYIQAKNYKEAAKYLEKAAMQGDLWSKKQLDTNPVFQNFD